MSEIPKPNIRNFNYVQMCLYRTFDALNEIKILSRARMNHAEVHFIVNGPLIKYARALHYVFVLEYMKLFEKKEGSSSNEHLASLEKLSFKILSELGDQFRSTHETVINKIDEIRKTDFFRKIKVDRDIKYAHSDAKNTNPYSFVALNDDDIAIGFQHLELIKTLNHYCSSAFGFEFIFDHADDRTDNFIVNHAKYQEYWFKNLRFS